MESKINQRQLLPLYLHPRDILSHFLPHPFSSYSSILAISLNEDDDALAFTFSLLLSFHLCPYLAKE
jgi:hypothetical protein